MTNVRIVFEAPTTPYLTNCRTIGASSQPASPAHRMADRMTEAAARRRLAAAALLGRARSHAVTARAAARAALPEQMASETKRAPGPAQRLRAGLQRGRARRGVLRARDRRARGLNYELDHRQRRLPRPHRASSSTRSPRRDPRLRVVHLSRNFGHQAALTAGLEHARGDAVAMLDADLQDPPELIPNMVAAWQDGADVVYMVREERSRRNRLQARDRTLVLRASSASSPRSTSSPTPATSACSTAARSTRCSRWASATASCAG